VGGGEREKNVRVKRMSDKKGSKRESGGGQHGIFEREGIPTKSWKGKRRRCWNFTPTRALKALTSWGLGKEGGLRIGGLHILTS